MADISKIKLPDNNTYDLKSRVTNSIPMAVVDSTSTNTAFTVHVPEFENETEPRDGMLFWIHNNKVTSASGWTLKVNDYPAKPVYLSSSSRSTTHFAKNRWFACWYSSTLVSGGCWIIGYLTDTTYSGMTVAEYEAGTSNTARLITPARLKDAINYYVKSMTSAEILAAVQAGWNGTN